MSYPAAATREMATSADEAPTGRRVRARTALADLTNTISAASKPESRSRLVVAPPPITAQKHAPLLQSILLSIALPFLFVLILPRIEPDERAAAPTGSHSRSQWQHLTSYYDVLETLVRFPLDKFRLGAGLVALVQAKEISSKSDLQQEEQTNLMHVAPAELRATYLAPSATHQPQHHAYGPAGEVMSAQPPTAGDYGGGLAPGAEPPPADMAAGELGPPGAGSEVGVGTSSGQALQTRSDLPAVRALNVKCEKNHMTVNIVFDRPFYGLVFSKGHYNDQKCVHLPANSGQTSVNFDIHLGKCGMASSDSSGGHSSALQARDGSQQPNGLYIENTIIIQFDPQVQEIYDQARKLRCTWYDYYEKSVTFRPYNVDMLDAVTANFLGDNIQCWMQIQVGKGPWSNEVAGIVKIGQTMTMVLAIKDDENRFDMLVRNCVAHDGKHQPIQLVDEYGCVARPKIMAKFQKVKNFGPAATVVSYAHFQAFKFPDSMSVHFQCVIQVCRYECPEPVCPNQPAAGELAGPSGGAADYAASGTEIVASKEPVPSYAFPAFAGAGHNGSHSSHALKLDESQGRVQVKLDTSMMAGPSSRPFAGGSRAAAQGPLPPHLLHAAGAPTNGQQQQHRAPTAGHAFLSSAPYQPRTQGARASNRVGAAASAPQPPPPLYSAAFPGVTSARAAPVQRMGELAAPPGGQESQQSLSLIALPRGLRMAPAALSSAPANHRLRRAVEREGGDGGRSRGSRALPSESTAVETQRSIQVVSPDDVAFSLLAEELVGEPQMSKSAAGRRQVPASVCFPAARLVVAALVTLATLAAGVLLAAYVILRQRARLEQKLSVVQEQRPQPDAREAELVARRQREELQRRHSYLARLYSQFAPQTIHWERS